MKFSKFLSKNSGGFGVDLAGSLDDHEQSPQWRAAKGLEGICQAARDMHAAIDAARSDKYLSRDGQEEKVQKVVEQTLRKLDDLRDRFLGIAWSNLQTLRGKLRTPQPGNDNVAGLLTQIEARSILWSLDGKERLKIFDTAVADGDEATFAAFDRQPAGMNLISPEALAEGRVRRLAQKDPITAKQLAKMEAIVPTMCDALRRFYRELALYANLDTQAFEICASTPARKSHTGWCGGIEAGA